MLVKDKIYNWSIYRITSPAGRVYIGKTVNLKKRISAYSSLRCQQQRLIYQSILKYGFSNHALDILEEFKGDDSMSQDKEMFWIRSFMSNKSKFPSQNGLNLTDGGGGAIGYVPSEATIQKLREYLIGKPSRNKKGTWTQETRDKMLKVHKGVKNPKKGRPWTEQRRKDKAESMKGNTNAKGRVVTEKEKEKMRIERAAYYVPVNKYTREGVFVKQYISIAEAARDVGCKYGQLMGHIRGVDPTCYNFIFKRVSK